MLEVVPIPLFARSAIGRPHGCVFTVVGRCIRREAFKWIYDAAIRTRRKSLKGGEWAPAEQCWHRPL